MRIRARELPRKAETLLSSFLEGHRDSYSHGTGNLISIFIRILETNSCQGEYSMIDYAEIIELLVMQRYFKRYTHDID